METDIREQLEVQEKLLECVKTLYYGRDTETSIQELLRIVGQFHQANRAYIFEYNDTGRMDNTYEWCAEGVSAEMDNLQNLLVDERWEAMFENHGIVRIEALHEEVDQSSEEYRLLSMQGISSLLVAPIELEGERIGFIGIDDPTAHESNETLLKSVAAFIADDIAKRQMLRKTSPEALRNTLDCLQAGIVVYQFRLPEMSIIACNDYMCEMMEFEKAPFLRQTRDGIMAPVHPDDMGIAEEFTKKLTSEKVAVAEAVYRLIAFRSRKVKYFHVKGQSYRQHDGSYLVYFVYFDITDRKELLEEIGVLEAASEAKTEFISRISHDIRTPIGAILNLTDFARADVDDREKLINDLDRIATSGRFLLSLINDVLDISKIDAGKIELKPELYAFKDYLTEIHNIIQPMCEERGLTLEFDTEEPPVEYMVTDRVRLNQVTLNIASNAAKYTNKGGKVAFRTRFETAEDGRTMCRIEVEDNGIGMSEAFQKHMFEEFSQEMQNPNRGTVSSGTGLGLSIAKKLVNLMGGDIEVASKLGRGTKVSILLPVDMTEEVAASEEPKFGADAATAEGKSDRQAEDDKLHGHILFAEDNEINAEIATRIFEELGVTTDHAWNGLEAVELFAASDNGAYEAVFMDIQMPEMNGFDAARAIRTLERDDAATVPIIAMTADAFTSAMEKAKASGMTDFTTKPLIVENLRNILLDIEHT